VLERSHPARTRLALALPTPRSGCFTGRKTAGDPTIRFHLLGPIDVRVGESSLPVGGRKQRTVLALLVLRSGEVVPVDRLIDELWSDDPPPSAAHTVEGYVSRLRGALQPFGPTIERRGGGYRLDLGGGSVDARMFVSLVEEGAAAAAAGEPERAAALSLDAVRLWRGPALADVSLRAEADHLEELRLRALEQRFDAELRLGRHADVVAELRTLVGEHPHRERLVAQLMLALYRSGRHADALAAYEATRRSLADELGLQPSADLQRLSGEIVRQEPTLLLRGAGNRPDRPDAEPRRRWRLVAAIGLTAAAAAVATVGLIRADDRQGAEPFRVALLLHRAPTVGLGDPAPSVLVEGLGIAERRYGVQTEWFVVPEGDPKAPAARAASERLRSNPVDLVIAPLRTIFSLTGVAEMDETRFVTLDVDWFDPLPRNTTAFVFDDRKSGYLVGYLSGLMEQRTGPRLNPRHIVSLIGGDRRAPTVERLLNGFTDGVRRALPDVIVLRSYSREWVDQSKCAAIANEHIDHGADIVFAAAGACGFGALSAAGIRGVWGIGSDGDTSYLGSHILASADKRYDRAVLLAVQSFLEKTLPARGRVVLGLDDNAVGITGPNVKVPADIGRRVAHAQAELRRGRKP
jgi:DNA-binding SARP family transcriptional activator